MEEVVCWGLCSNFVDCEFFLESNSPRILAVCETNLNDPVDSGNFSVKGYLPLMKEGPLFALDLSLENSYLCLLLDSYLCFRLALLNSFSYFFFLYWSPSLSGVFVLQLLSFDWEILIMLLSQSLLTFHQIHNRMPTSLHSLLLFSCWLGWSLWSFER